MDMIYRRVAGLDVHKKAVTTCVRIAREDGSVWREVRTFSTLTHNLHALQEWLQEHGVTHVAMESTGTWWKPIYNVLEEHFTLVLVNPRDIKRVPGRKTDVKDSEWIAQLLQCGLLSGSFVPKREGREMRELTRHRTKLVQQHTAVVNRLHSVLQDANIKLSSVASDILGVSGREMIEALRDGEQDPQALAQLARGKLRTKLPELRRALEGRVREHHRFMLEVILDQLDFLARAIDRVGERIEAVKPPSLLAAVELLKTIDGVGQRTAENVLAEIGEDMSQFPTHRHLSSWAGLCPGNNESAGRQTSGKTRKGDAWLRGYLAEAATAACRTRNGYLRARYNRLAARRGKKRALTAVSHSLLIAIYHVLRSRQVYRDLGPEHFQRLDPQRAIRYHLRKLEALGQKVTIAPLTEEAA
jgi:transposase